jgi:RNA polymerase primary sigma factor
MVRLPVHLIESLGTLRRTTRQLSATLGRAPTDEELATAIGSSVTRVRQLQLLDRQHLSLDLPVGSQSESTLGDVLPDTRMLEPETALIERSRYEAIWRLIASSTDLSETERQIISMRYGLADGERQTLQEIGDQFKLTRERIRQIEVRALKKLQADARRVQLKTYLED